MAEFVSLEPGVEVLGEVIAAFIAGFPVGTERVATKILQRHGIMDPRPGDWYPIQSLLDAMRDTSDTFGANMLARIGEQIATNAKLPPGLDDLETVLASIDTAYHMNHQGGEIGHYVYEFKGLVGGLTRATMVCPNPYPCSFDRGVIEGFSRRFKPEGAIDVLVRHDDSEPCRKTGAESCTYVISWG